MNAWVWVVIILWLLFMATYAWGMCRSAWRENPPMPDPDDMTAEEFDRRYPDGEVTR